MSLCVVLKGGVAVITHKHCPFTTYCVLVFTTVLFVLTGWEVSNRHESHFCLHGKKMSLLVQLWNQWNSVWEGACFLSLEVEKWIPYLEFLWLLWNGTAARFVVAALGTRCRHQRGVCSIDYPKKTTKLFCFRKKNQWLLSAVMELKSGFQRTFSP